VLSCISHRDRKVHWLCGHVDFNATTLVCVQALLARLAQAVCCCYLSLANPIAHCVEWPKCTLYGSAYSNTVTLTSTESKSNWYDLSITLDAEFSLSVFFPFFPFLVLFLFIFSLFLYFFWRVTRRVTLYSWDRWGMLSACLARCVNYQEPHSSNG
jgi:hypothetical protein